MNLLLQVRIVVGVHNAPSTVPGTLTSVSVVLKDYHNRIILKSLPFTVNAGIPPYAPEDASLATHEASEWSDGAKFGLFVHWGVYSVPSWTISGTQYAEWYVYPSFVLL
jgi:alpha-L-fucosidase